MRVYDSVSITPILDESRPTSLLSCCPKSPAFILFYYMPDYYHVRKLSEGITPVGAPQDEIESLKSVACVADTDMRLIPGFQLTCSGRSVKTVGR